MQQAKINKGDSLKKIQRIQMGNKINAMDYKSPKKNEKKKEIKSFEELPESEKF